MPIRDLEEACLAELLRVVGHRRGTEFYSFPSGSDEAQLRAALARLRALPSGLGWEELARRFGPEPPA